MAACGGCREGKSRTCPCPLFSSSLWSQEEQMRQKDSRARLTSCILRNVRTVKYHGWEGAFLDRVLSIRAQELGALRTSSLLFSVSLVSFQVSTFLVMSLWSPCRAWTGGGSAGGGDKGSPYRITGSPSHRLTCWSSYHHHHIDDTWNQNTTKPWNRTTP